MAPYTSFYTNKNIPTRRRGHVPPDRIWNRGKGRLQSDSRSGPELQPSLASAPGRLADVEHTARFHANGVEVNQRLGQATAGRATGDAASSRFGF
jgi:hypothetical protein